jgi:LuxR family maltose regulon positive regulatory protein
MPGQANLASQLVEPLSGRELEVLHLLAQGCTDKKIAETLVIAPETVHKHLKNIYGKLDVHSRLEATLRAREIGLL